MLTKKTIDIVKATAPVVGKHSEEITTCFYKTMFGAHPELLKTFFNKTHQAKGKQPKSLADAVVTYATHIDDLGNPDVGELVGRMCSRHVALSVLPPHYKIVYENMMKAIPEVLGDAVTEDVGNAWSEAVLALADICIKAEEEIYKANEKRVGGWRLEREFELTNKEPVAEDTIRFTFAPTDGYTGEFEFTTGQYLSIRTPRKEIAPRHYTITSKPFEKSFQITTRLAKGEVPGDMSTFMHRDLQKGEKVSLAAPCGVFVPGDNTKNVLISAGIGCTPMIAFLKHFGADKVNSIFHVERTKARDVWQDQQNKQLLGGIDTKTWYTKDNAGRPDLKKEAAELVSKAGTDATYYTCGPTEFMDQVSQALQAQGAKDVRYEVFGTGTIQTNRESKCPFHGATA